MGGSPGPPRPRERVEAELTRRRARSPSSMSRASDRSARSSPASHVRHHSRSTACAARFSALRARSSAATARTSPPAPMMIPVRHVTASCHWSPPAPQYVRPPLRGLVSLPRRTSYSCARASWTRRCGGCSDRSRAARCAVRARLADDERSADRNSCETRAALMQLSVHRTVTSLWYPGSTLTARGREALGVRKPALCRLFRLSGREDLNLRPPGPQPGALPGCATPRSPASIAPGHRPPPRPRRHVALGRGGAVPRGLRDARSRRPGCVSGLARAVPRAHQRADRGAPAARRGRYVRAVRRACAR